MGRQLVVASCIIVGLVGYLFYVPIYDGYENTTSMRKFFTTWHAKNLINRFSDAIGYETYFNLTRYEMEVEIAAHPVQLKSAGVESENFEIDGMVFRVYRPEGVERELPAIIYYHGGGWVVCSIDTHDTLVRDFSRDVGAVVISVSYRLAPENPFPAAFDDCFKATLHLIKQGATKFKFDPKRLALAGDSAGGNLAAAISLKLREDKDIIQPKLQILLYPALQAFDMNLPAYQQNEHDPFMDKTVMIWFWALYAEGHLNNADKYFNNEHVSSRVMTQMQQTYLNHASLPEKLKMSPYEPAHEVNGDETVWSQIESVFLNPFFNPLIADDLSGVPTAYVVTGQHDVLRDDGFLYARRLKQAGVNVIHQHNDIAFHDAGIFGPDDEPKLQEMKDKMTSDIKKLL